MIHHIKEGRDDYSDDPDERFVKRREHRDHNLLVSMFARDHTPDEFVVTVYCWKCEQQCTISDGSPCPHCGARIEIEQPEPERPQKRGRKSK